MPSACRALPALLLGLALAGCGASLRELPTATELERGALEASEQYVIGPRDVLQITVWRQPELSVPEVAVRLDGRISVPLLDDVQAAGYTPLALKAIITERLEEFVAAPHVTVVVRQSNSKIVFVLGEVAKEGPVVLFPDMRVIDAIAVAGGFNPFSGRDRIKVIRNRNGSAPVEFVFDYDAFVDGDNLESNILLLPGDRIIVPEEKPFWSR